MMKTVNIIGGGPAGLMAASILSQNNYQVTIYERKPSLGRKFLLAGRGGLNITHSEKKEAFFKNYGKNSEIFKPIITQFSPQDLRKWCEQLGENTFVGSSGRVFPESFKASPLLRTWLSQLKTQKVIFKTKHDWLGWEDNKLLFKSDNQDILVNSGLTILSLGGASWPQLGSDGSWVNILEKYNIEVSKLQPSNCGFFVNWSEIFANRFAGKPLKSVKIKYKEKIIKGEFVITKDGIEGGAIYTLSSLIREAINIDGEQKITVDLKPDFNINEINKRLSNIKSNLSMTNYLRKNIKLSDVAIGLLMEIKHKKNSPKLTAQTLPYHIKNFELSLKKPFSIKKCISTAGGVSFNSVDKNFMLIKKPNVYVAGEMIDWEAPTGGYLLQACIASGFFVANNILKKNIKK
ncbi:TIGR03862 family flavoprotein [Alphaproteobacteria bacterium]|nr:TIGR03862 family flavoprotein [Alphaproteobacteria bacterium]